MDRTALFQAYRPSFIKEGLSTSAVIATFFLKMEEGTAPFGPKGRSYL
jgi:hypothetical protein